MAGAALKRWDAARRLYEGEEVSADLIAELTGHEVSSVRSMARKQGWKARRASQPLKQAVRALIDRLTRDAERLAETDGALAAGDVNALNAMFKTIHALSDLTGGGESRAKKARENDDRLAKLLGRIDVRIEELAQVRAREMLRRGWQGERGA